LDHGYLLPKPPAKPLSAYNLFTRKLSKMIREKYPAEPNTVIMKKLANLWQDNTFQPELK